MFLAALGLGLLGLYALVEALVGAMNVAATLVLSQNVMILRGVLLSEFVPAALLLAIGYVLVFHNTAVAAAMFPGMDVSSEPDAGSLPRVLVGLTGMLLLGMAIPGLIRAAFAYSMGRNFQSATSLALQLRGLIGSAVQGALAVYLILRPDRVLALWRHKPVDDDSAVSAGN